MDLGNGEKTAEYKDVEHMATRGMIMTEQLLAVRTSLNPNLTVVNPFETVRRGPLHLTELRQH